MDATQIHATFKTALRFLGLGELKKTFEKTKKLTSELQIGEYSDKLSAYEQNYHYLLEYYAKGVEDPKRKAVYNKLIANLFLLISMLREELLMRNSSNFEYSQKRYFPHTRKYFSAQKLFDALQNCQTQMEVAQQKEDITTIRKEYETILPEVFALFWLTSIYSQDERNLFQQILTSTRIGVLETSLMISALTLNLWRMFDESKLSLLFDACESDNPQIKQRALVGLCFVLAKHNRFLPYFPVIRNRLVVLTDNQHTVENLQNIIVQLISTADTDKVSKKLQEEILPEIMKISPMIKDKLDAENTLDTDDWEETNPEWQNMLEDGNISEKMQELTELQMEGADIYMSTFSMLKSFPFFQQISHWFLPFDTNSSDVNALFNANDKNILTAFMNNDAMCNSDKYSFCLSILQMPESQRNMMKQSFKMESEQLEEMQKDEAMLTPNATAKSISKQYVQDLFRFFKLHPNRSDFSDMFASALFMHKSYLFDILSSNSQLKENIAEYYFAKNHHSQALDLFEELQHKEQSAALYQKMGFSYQQTSQLTKALEAYLKADVIQPDDLWTIRKIALCYRLLGNYKKALEFYQHADFLKPNQQSTLLHIGNCYLEEKKYKEALAIYFKLEPEAEKNVKVWRAIAWTSFVSGNLSQAEYFAQKLLDRVQPTPQDYLNAGHIAWCQHRIPDAIELYKKCYRVSQSNWELLADMMNNDKQYLTERGIDKDEFPLLMDALQYEIKTKF